MILKHFLDIYVTNELEMQKKKEIKKKKQNGKIKMNKRDI